MQIKILLSLAISILVAHHAVQASDFTPMNPLTAEQTAITEEWSAIWKSKDPNPGLQKFKQKHGLFLETGPNIGKISILAFEGPCDNTHVSLVKDAKFLNEEIREIDAKGKVLRKWNPGTLDIDGIEGNKLFRKIKLFEAVTDFSQYTAGKDPKPHNFVLAIGADNSIELLPEDFKIKSKWEYKSIKCPPHKDIDSELQYCVKLKNAERIFLLNYPCT